MKKNSEKVTADNFFDNTISAKSANRKKFTKIFAGISLATLITCGTVLGFAPLASSSVSGNSSTSSSMSATTTAESAEDLKTHVAEYKADIESGKIKYAPSALGLDPANDPVLFTTESGLEIKMSNANPGAINGGKFANSALNGYTYLTMGSYNGYAINWLLTAVSNKLVDTTSPAGKFLNSLTSKNAYITAPIPGTNNLYCDSTLPAGQARLISESVFGTSQGITLSYLQSAGTGQVSIYKEADTWGGTRVVGTNHFSTTVTNYIANDTLGLAQYRNNGFITTDLFIPPDSLINLLTTKIAYSIETGTATAYWNANGYSQSRSDFPRGTYSSTVYKAYYDTTGTLVNATVGTYTVYCDKDYDRDLRGLTNTDNTAAIRTALVIKFM